MRNDHQIISGFIAENSRVLDLGCGDGSLLKSLKDQKSVRGLGIEIDHAKFNRCLERGVSVIDQNLDDGLSNFASDSFDMVVLSQTLQALHRPDLVLQEMFRISRQAVVAFPNFGHWKPRLHLITRGRMPVSELMPYEWYDTPNIHFCTVKDFEVLCAKHDWRIENKALMASETALTGFSKSWPNLFAETAIYHLSRD